jgi:hypothetical protein
MKSEHNSFLHNIQIASPCKADWDKMTGDERARFCQDCKLNVYNLAEMTLPEAEQLIIDTEGNVCLQIYRRHDGTVITKDCPVGLAQKLKRKAVAVAGALAASAAFVFAWFGQTRAAEPDPASASETATVTTTCAPVKEMGQAVSPARAMGKISVRRPQPIKGKLEDTHRRKH